MLEEKIHSSRRQDPQEFVSEKDFDISIVDVLRFFSDNKTKLIKYFLLLSLVGLGGFLAWRLTRPLKVQGRLALSFKGIEKGEYPDGRKFSIEDVRSPDIVSLALMDAKIAKDRDAAVRIFPEVEIAPVIPRSLAMRWAKQDKEGTPREEYFPNEFDISIPWDFPFDGGSIFFEALVKRYREGERAAQLSAFQIVRNNSQSNYYLDLLQNPNYEYADVARILDSRAGPLNLYLSRMLGSASDPLLQAGLRDVQDELALWSGTYLETLKAMTHAGGVVKNKETAAARVRYRKNDYSILIRQKTEETAEAFKLLATIQKPQPMPAGQMSRDAVISTDATVLERLASSSYVAPLVKKISDLQHETKALEAESMRMERDAALIAQAHNVAPERLPAGYQDAVVAASKELERIVANYDKTIDRYLTSSVANSITIKDGPRIVRDSPSASRMIALIFLVSGSLSIAYVYLDALLRGAARAKEFLPQ